MKGCAPGSNKPKALPDLQPEEAASWLDFRLRSLRLHECICDIGLAREALAVAERINAVRDAEYLRGLISKLNHAEEA